MKNSKHIKKFNESDENLNISDTSKKFSIDDLSDFGQWLDDNAQQREYYPMNCMTMKELVQEWLKK